MADDDLIAIGPEGVYASVPDVGAVPDLWDDPVHERTAPDGKPWRKSCGECAFRDKMMITPIEATCRDRDAAFYCAHRETVGGHTRVCASFAARDHGRRQKEPAHV